MKFMLMMNTPGKVPYQIAEWAAIAHYRRAAERTTSTAERDYLLTHAARLAETP